MAGQTKDIASGPNRLVKALWRGRHWVWGPNRRRAMKEESMVINRELNDLVDAMYTTWLQLVRPVFRCDTLTMKMSNHNCCCNP